MLSPTFGISRCGCGIGIGNAWRNGSDDIPHYDPLGFEPYDLSTGPVTIRMNYSTSVTSEWTFMIHVWGWCRRSTTKMSANPGTDCRETGRRRGLVMIMGMKQTIRAVFVEAP